MLAPQLSFLLRPFSGPSLSELPRLNTHTHARTRTHTEHQCNWQTKAQLQTASKILPVLSHFQQTSTHTCTHAHTRAHVPGSIINWITSHPWLDLQLAEESRAAKYKTLQIHKHACSVLCGHLFCASVHTYTHATASELCSQWPYRWWQPGQHSTCLL